MIATRRATLVRWAATALHRARLLRPLSVAAAYGRRRPVFQVLTYHRVNDENDPFFPSVPTAVFEQQMAYLARACRVTTVEDLVEQGRRGRLPRNAVAVTFDDGYRDTFTHAAPVLARHGLRATVFLATGFIGTGAVPWFDRLAMAFKTTAVAAVATPWGSRVPLTGEAARLWALDQTVRYLKALPDDERRVGLGRLLDALAVTDGRWSKDWMLDWDAVQALTGLGFSIGAHTVSHPILSKLDLERARTEIVDSRRAIESACGLVPRAFAYPNGRPEDYTAAVQRLVREAGFSCAVTTRFGVNTCDTPPYELRRGRPWEHDLPTFAFKLSVYRLWGAGA